MGSSRHEPNDRVRFDRDSHRGSDGARPVAALGDQIAALEKHIASQRQLSSLLEPGSIARGKSDAICRDMIGTLDKLRSKASGRPSR